MQKKIYAVRYVHYLVFLLFFDAQEMGWLRHMCDGVGMCTGWGGGNKLFVGCTCFVVHRIYIVLLAL